MIILSPQLVSNVGKIASLSSYWIDSLELYVTSNMGALKITMVLT